jgi:hypothetical protein
MVLTDAHAYMFVSFILVLCLFIVIVKQCGPTNYTLRKAYKQNEDDLNTMLNRISWANHHRGRINYNARFVGISIVTAFLVSIVVYDGRLPDFISFIQILLVVFFCNIVPHAFLTYHSDKFASYAIEENVNSIRQKINIQLDGDVNNLSEQTERITPNHPCFQFIYDV